MKVMVSKTCIHTMQYTSRLCSTITNSITYKYMYTEDVVEDDISSADAYGVEGRCQSIRVKTL